MAEVNPPSWLQGGCYTAEMDRNMLGSFICSEGVCSVTDGDLQVTDGSTGMEIQIAAGCAWVRGDTTVDQGFYYVRNDASVTQTLSASDPTDDRIDLVIAHVYDSQYIGSVDEWVIEIVTGTASPSPSPPTVPDSALVLAEVYVTAGSSTVDSGDITDRRSSYKLCLESQPVQGLTEMVVYDSSGTFEKANYPGARAVRVRMVGGGGGGGGSQATDSGESSVGGGGGGGAYAESLLNIADLAASETVTVGSRGTVSNASAGGKGGDSSFGTHVVAEGGDGGGVVSLAGSSAIDGAVGGQRVSSTGQITSSGGPGGVPSRDVSTPGSSFSGAGGGSAFGAGAIGLGTRANGAIVGRDPGGGGGGSKSSGVDSARPGGEGGRGLVIVEVLY